MASRETKMLVAPSIGRRRIAGLVVIALLLAGFFVAAGIPFWFESSTIHYKFGVDKTLLRTGKILGLLAGTLMLVQLVIAARSKFLDRIFTLNRLCSYHRVIAGIVAGLALVHPILIFAPEDPTTVPIDPEFWPEMTGLVLLFMLWAMMGTGFWRLFLQLPFEKWRLAHRIAAVAVGCVFLVHVLFVSDSFESGVPYWGAIAAAAVYVLLFVWTIIGPMIGKDKKYRVQSIVPAGPDAYNVVLEPESGRCFDYLPGQFAFIRFRSEHQSGEEHPFTISSSPTLPGALHFTIRCLGDWTSRVGQLQPGDKAIVDGPYGLFSCLTAPTDKPLIMIAGGIGITPMLSMLRYMADTGDDRSILLLWNNRTEADIAFPNELTDLEHRLPNLQVVHVLSRDPKFEGERGRLDKDRLARLLEGRARDSAVFVCGPPRMMKSVKSDLFRIGFERKNIISEEFKL